MVTLTLLCGLVMCIVILVKLIPAVKILTYKVGSLNKTNNQSKLINKEQV